MWRLRERLPPGGSDEEAGEGVTSQETQESQHNQPEAGGRATFDAAQLQRKWRPVWERLDPFKAADDGSRERRYALTMFPT